MFYITFHKTESNVWAYDHTAKLKTTKLLATPACAPQLDELRGLTFGPNGYLYVANGYKSFNQVLAYSGSGDSDGAYKFIGVYADPTVSPALAHPFAVAFDSSNNGYVSNQDTNVVTALTPPTSGQPCDATPTPPAYSKATALPVASYLTNLGTFLPATFVASCYGALNGVSPVPPNVAQPQGLDLDPPTGPASHSVRDVLVSNGLLYVADEPGNAVKVYDLSTGQLQSQITDDHLQSPVHLLLSNSVLYISSNHRIMAYNLVNSTISTFLTGLTSPSGMAFDSDNNFLFADRTTNTIFQATYDPKKKQYAAPAVFIPPYDDKHPDGLQDNPEFLLYIKSD